MMALSEEDRHLAERVLKSIKQDAGLCAYEINVTARDGVVHLAGIVDVQAEKMRAEEIAARLDGVAAVENDLTVCADGQVTDDDVNFEVSEELRLDPRVDFGRVYAESKRGVVHLYGKVDSLADRQAAISAAARARGVKEVVSHLEVAGGKGLDDPTITNRVRAAIAAKRGIDSELISATTRHGAVRLEGRVPSARQAEFAEEVVRNTEGPRRIDNLLMAPPPGTTAPEQAAHEVRQALAKHPSLAERVSVSLMDGKVVLEGELADLEQKRTLEKLARPVVERFGREVTGLDMRVTVDTR